MHSRMACYIVSTILAAAPLLVHAAAAPSGRLACQTGTEDEHARIAMDVTKGKVQRFAYYSKWKPKTCSIAATRGDAYTKWVDKGNVTTVTLPKGTATIEQEKGGVYRVTFRNADRELYCGLEGEINGTVTVAQGKRECGLDGVMERPESLQAEPERKEPESSAK